MKKLLIVTVCLALIFSLCACSAAPISATEPPTEAPTQAARCYHNFTSEITLEATCEAEGTLTYTCSLCDFSYDEVIDIASHNFSEATCIDGEFCSACGTYRGDALGHDMSDATCTAAASCARCGKTEGSALGHSYEEGVCLNCGQDEPA